MYPTKSMNVLIIEKRFICKYYEKCLAGKDAFM